MFVNVLHYVFLIVKIVSSVFQNNRLYSLDLSNNPKLDFLLCAENRLSSLNVSQNLLPDDVTCYGISCDR